MVYYLDRNLTAEEREGYKEIRWDSKEVCAYYMARFCPYDHFVNTKCDLGKEINLNFNIDNNKLMEEPKDVNEEMRIHKASHFDIKTKQEAEKVAVELLATSVGAKAIIVQSPYVAQVQLLRERLDELPEYALSSYSSIAFYFVLYLFSVSSIVCNCQVTGNYTDPKTRLAWISDNGIMNNGKLAIVQNPTGNWMQYQTRRDFPVENKKYYYTINTTKRRGYLVRVTFLYGDLGDEDAYPKFDLYIDATKWSTVTILDASRVYYHQLGEMI
ncbi:hypothetical protein K2173_011533 [Erythroxylum novogranatense]|uniref:Malectin-like domain-containing protein n=1 Tax=Erythroxylum novogranatense TaxID=1862640 RepID=A0AAV8TVP0_9ROSI|nr:hypothetical protein K2173_011533 [Erythroxylum novogranatense]